MDDAVVVVDDDNNEDVYLLAYRMMVNQCRDYVCHNELKINVYIYIHIYIFKIKRELRFLPRPRFPPAPVEDV